MTNASQRATPTECPACGIAQRPGDTQCWLCHTNLSSTPPGERRFSGAGAFAPRSVEPRGFSLASLMMFITLVSVIFGLSTIVPGVGIPLGVLLLIAWGRTVNISRQHTQAGMPLSFSEKTRAYFSSLGFIISLLLLVTLAVIIGFGSICFGLIAAAETAQTVSPLASAGGIAILIVGVAVALGMLHLANKWNDLQFWRAGHRPKNKNDDRNEP